MTESQDAGNEHPCQGCALCCKYISVRVKAPDNPEDLDTMIWYLYHGTEVFLDDAGWHLKVNSDCDHLNAMGRCNIYESRPAVCRDYSMSECEKHDDRAFWQIFRSSDELLRYLRDSPIRPEA